MGISIIVKHLIELNISKRDWVNVCLGDDSNLSIQIFDVEKKNI